MRKLKERKFSGSLSPDITEREIKLADKLKALELLGKHLGMFTDKLGIDLQPSEKLSDILAQLGGEGLEE